MTYIPGALVGIGLVAFTAIHPNAIALLAIGACSTMVVCGLAYLGSQRIKNGDWK